MYADLVKEQLPEVSENQILLEPARRNTAPCIAWASYHIRALNPNANIVVAPSDHLILKEDEFLAAIEKGLDFVSRSEKLLTLGIKPNRPETGYGYIQIDEPAGGNFYKVKTFTEKPELELAKVFVESGEFYRIRKKHLLKKISPHVLMYPSTSVLWKKRITCMYR